MGLFNQPTTDTGSGLYVGEQYVSTQIGGTFTIITAFDPLIITQDGSVTSGDVTQIPNNLDLVVYANHLTIAGPISIPGKNVTINARLLSTQNDNSGNAAKISVDGTQGGPPPLPLLTPSSAGPGEDAQEPFTKGYGQPDNQAGVGGAGTAGSAGAAGAGGTAAGSITLNVEQFANAAPSLSADGGAGGGGQAGQSGSNGGTGGNGVQPNYRPLYPAAEGGAGGAAGAGGIGGAGGAAGTIQVGYVTGTPSISASASGGAGGAGGAAGTPGQGGAGGTNPGGGGASTGATGASANNGSTGGGGASTTPLIASIQYQALAAASSAAQLLLALQLAKVTFLAADPSDTTGAAFQQAAALFTFLVNVTATSPSTFSAADVTTMQNINSEATTLVARLAKGIDFYGNTANWVPVASYATYDDSLSTMITDLNTTAGYVTSFYTDWASQSQTLANINNAVSQANGALNDATTALAVAQNAAPPALDAINSDNVAVANQYQVLVRQISALESQLEAIAQQEIGEQCVFDTMIKGLNLISTISGQKAFATAGKIVSGIQQLVPGASGDAGASLAAQVQKLDVLGSTITSLPEGVTNSGQYITEADPNAYKILQDQTSFDTLVQKFTGITGLAQSAIDAMNTYVQLVLQRNSDVLAYNTIINQINSLNAEIAHLNAFISQSGDQAATANPQLLSLVGYISKLYEDSKWRIIRQLYLTFRALAYWSLNTSYESFFTLARISGLDQVDAGTLSSIQSSLKQDWTDSIAAFKTPPQTFPETGPGIQMTITNPDVINLLKTQHTAYVTVPAALPGMDVLQTPFSQRCNVRVTKARPWLIGAVAASGNSSGYVQSTIWHMGRETIVDQSGESYIFTHDPSYTVFSYKPSTSTPENPADIQSDPNFGYTDPDATYALYSPFTTFYIHVDPTSADLSNLSALTMEFWGTNDVFDTTETESAHRSDRQPAKRNDVTLSHS